jgi:hypothetical protein
LIRGDYLGSIALRMIAAFTQDSLLGGVKWVGCGRKGF